MFRKFRTAWTDFSAYMLVHIFLEGCDGKQNKQEINQM